jgi:hypothetical protein
MGEKRNACRVLLGNPRRKENYLEDVGIATR